MGANINVYGFGKDGVNIVKSPLHLGDAEATQLQNAELVPDEALGGEGALNKRGGLAALNGSALAGSVLGLVNLPLQTTYVRTLYVALTDPDNGGPTFLRTTDGTTFTNTSSPLQAARRLVENFIASPSTYQQDENSRRYAAFGKFIIYPGASYTSGTSAPTLVYWDGATAAEITRIPNGPSAAGTGLALYVGDMIAANGKVYFIVQDDNAATIGRVMSLDISTGQLAQVGNAWGSGTGQINDGLPGALCWYQGQLFAGESVSASPKVWRIYPDIDAAWTQDAVAGVATDDAILSMCEFKGDLYASTRGSGVGVGKIYKRAASSSAWSQVHTVTGSASAINGLITYDGALYALDREGSTPRLHVLKSTDGASWSTDLDIDSVHSASMASPVGTFGMPIVFGSDLFVLVRCINPNTTANDGFILRKRAGSWAMALDNQEIENAAVILTERS